MAKKDDERDLPERVAAGVNPPAEKYAREYIPDEELPMPRIQIVQKDTDDLAAGVFLNTQTEETFAELECILLGVRRGRIRWDSTLKNMDEPLCRSRDAVNGVGDPGGPCIKCPKAEWRNGDKPECALVYDFIGVDATGAPFLLSVKRTGIKPARNFIAAAQRRKKPLYYTGCRLTLRKQTKPADYYVPVFKREGDVSQDQWNELEAILAQVEAAMERAPEAAPSADDDF
jgi:hypothetical protein